ncbi:class I SAM-dependent methyltransferase [Roseomonas sp. HJA6]|uniref:Class I SAM-dependent methyltransferase n=1 Tax=Roseomonas alba TaxID=2846776 RepID=A0ABS7AF86_9PROT|nr:class I SAM-dependent methyltransferase [Neoroseomonas alba]MBW6400966.1 class I SAM-dependent methyltransferase [Neoroseomonas alba]
MSAPTSHYGAAEVRYVTAFQAEASPARLHYALALSDTHWAPADRERLTVLDIGCGLGVTARLLAAANPGWDVYGIDLQPAHIAEAREAAAAAGVDNVHFLEVDLTEHDEAGFERLLPEVDIVVCWGVWTWVPDAAREGVVRLLKSRVKPGGVVLMAYNALPGYSDTLVMQRLLEEACRNTTGSLEERGMAAFAAIEMLKSAGALHLPQEQMLARMIDSAKRAPGYMVHEWLTSFWRPVYHADIATALQAARLDYAGSANPSRSLPTLQLNAEQRAAIEQAPPGIHRETLFDLFLQRRFRTDLYVRGRRSGGGRALAEIPLVLAVAPELMDTSIATAAGEAVLKAEHQAILAGALADGPRMLGELAALPGLGDLTMMEIAVMLIESGSAHPLWRPITRDPVTVERALRSNVQLLTSVAQEGAAGGSVLGAVAPALGSAIAASPSDLAVLIELQKGVPPMPAEIAQRLIPGDAPPEMLTNATGSIEQLLAMRLGAWRGLGLL